MKTCILHVNKSCDGWELNSGVAKQRDLEVGLSGGKWQKVAVYPHSKSLMSS